MERGWWRVPICILPHPAQYLGEVAVGPGAAAEALLITQTVVDGRLHHMACVDLTGTDVVLVPQAAKQVLGVARELGVGKRGSAHGGQARAAHLHRQHMPMLPGFGCNLTLTRAGDERGRGQATGKTCPTTQGKAHKPPFWGCTSLRVRTKGCVRGFRS